MQAAKRVKDPRKQRKRLFNAPAHIRHKLMAAPLAPELIKSRGAKSLPVRKGDTVRVMRGDRKGFEGKISRVDVKNYRLYVEGLTREKVDGTTIFISLHPSKVMIKNLNLDDKWRKESLERKEQLATKEQEVVKKQPEASVKAKTEQQAEVKAIAEKKIEKPAKEPEAPVKKPEAAKKLAEKKTVAAKPKKPVAVKKEKKAVKKETKTEAPVKKTRAKRKPAEEGGV